MFTMSWDDSEVSRIRGEVARCRRQVAPFKLVYEGNGKSIAPAYEGEGKDNETLEELEKQYVRKVHAAPFSVEVPFPVSEQVARRLVLRHSLWVKATVTVDKTTRIEFAEIPQD